MIDGKPVLALIPARGGSKGVPHKNIRQLGGKPLIAWTIDAAKASRYVDRIVLSTDDPNIIAHAERHGCEVPFVRPAALATDQAESMDVVRHALKALAIADGYVVLLQPTSPMRRADDIDGALECCVNSGALSCVSVCEPDKSPYWMLTMGSDRKVHSLFPEDQIPARRQDAPSVVALNGAVYVAPASHLVAGGNFLTKHTVGYPMPKERSFDIDTELDLRIVESILTEGPR
ncbi:acylneuraminate cytidylyltransferase family protein [Tardiphaga sp. 866_E4_N2_1]|uniref:acylneuraminate cytidylyltransferase family protein n=1 Tax=unclassified Tardiphaga TaxID=2631404 RepID=UPI003F28B00C